MKIVRPVVDAVGGVGETVRDLGRLNEVAQVLIKHGFGFVVAGLDLAGLALFVTVLQFAIRPLLAMIDDPGLQVAFVHSAFNLSAATLALILLPWLWRYLERYVPKSEIGISG